MKRENEKMRIFRRARLVLWRNALAGHEVSRIVSCIVAKRADETAYNTRKYVRISARNVPATRGTLASPSTRPIVRHRLQGRMRVHRTESAGDTASLLIRREEKFARTYVVKYVGP